MPTPERQREAQLPICGRGKAAINGRSLGLCVNMGRGHRGRHNGGYRRRRRLMEPPAAVGGWVAAVPKVRKGKRDEEAIY